MKGVVCYLRSKVLVYSARNGTLSNKRAREPCYSGTKHSFEDIAGGVKKRHLHGTVLLLFVKMIVEFRIPLPIAVNDFEVAQLYMITRVQENVTGGGEGVIVLKNEPFGWSYRSDT